MANKLKKVVLAETNQSASRSAREVARLVTKSNESAQSSHRAVMDLLNDGSQRSETQSNESAQASTRKVDEILNSNDD